MTALTDQRRDALFLGLSGTFLGTLTMMNILGVTRFLDASFSVPGTGVVIPVPLAIGVLPYPVTFLCTDFISELYGRRRANAVVWMGLFLNAWLVFVLWLGGALPTFGNAGSEPDLFMRVRALAFGNVIASMVAYLVAQRVDVELFHFWRRLTRGKHLWLRNNGSTLISQLIDSVCVTLITYYFAQGLPVNEAEPLVPQLATFISASYVYKLLAALLDTLPFYFGVLWLFPRLGVMPESDPDEVAEHQGDTA